MTTNENPSIKSLNELLGMFMRQAALERKSRGAAERAVEKARPTVQPSKGSRSKG